MRPRGLGHAVFAVALGGLGVLSLVSGDFAYVCQPVPAWVIGRSVLAYASGALLLACSAGLLWPRTLARSSLVLAFYGIGSMLLLHAPRIARKPLEEGEWFNLGELATFVAGAWLLFAGAAPVPAASGEMPSSASGASGSPGGSSPSPFSRSGSRTSCTRR
jgi:hypothetical protein